MTDSVMLLRLRSLLDCTGILEPGDTFIETLCCPIAETYFDENSILYYD